jgi:hypothetical protein
MCEVAEFFRLMVKCPWQNMDVARLEHLFQVANSGLGAAWQYSGSQQGRSAAERASVKNT